MNNLIGQKPNEKQIEAASHLLALEGGWAQLLQQMGKVAFDKYCAERLLEEALKQPAYPINDVPAYGIIKKVLSPLTEPPKNYSALENIVWGLNNCIVPHRVLRELNSSEILGLYCGIGRLKHYGNIRRGDVFLEKEEVFKKSFEEQVSILVSYAYAGYAGIRNLKGKGYRGHSTNKGDMKKRMLSVDKDSQNKFIESMKQPTRGSNRVDKLDGFFDPNAEGKTDFFARKIYGKYIADAFAQISSHKEKK